jgi:hypothetical protein
VGAFFAVVWEGFLLSNGNGLPGAKALWLGVAIVRAKARTYLRGKDRGNGKSERRSRFPEGMTERKARATAKAKEEADSRRE